MLYDFAFFSHQVGGFLGVWLGGILFERMGSYDIVWWLSACLGMASAVTVVKSSFLGGTLGRDTSFSIGGGEVSRGSVPLRSLALLRRPDQVDRGG
jgi:hypothetical protein